MVWIMVLLEWWLEEGRCRTLANPLNRSVPAFNPFGTRISRPRRRGRALLRTAVRVMLNSSCKFHRVPLKSLSYASSCVRRQVACGDAAIGIAYSFLKRLTTTSQLTVVRSEKSETIIALRPGVVGLNS